MSQHALAWSNQGLRQNGYQLAFPGDKEDRDGPKKSPTQISLTLFGHQGGYEIISPDSEDSSGVFESPEIPA